MLSSLEDKQLVSAGDGWYDSPGNCAKYCTQSDCSYEDNGQKTSVRDPLTWNEKLFIDPCHLYPVM